ncbi:unnamed protein product [Haemonchus placei]|uniref:Uncharacterized protein n=1 Tax=Haemonchus placei TaxID=6290 RepID=A0A0N4X5J7_HAEPC|nr:unnamed protein product [Haemonchus placei]
MSTQPQPQAWLSYRRDFSNVIIEVGSAVEALRVPRRKSEPPPRLLLRSRRVLCRCRSPEAEALRLLRPQDGPLLFLHLGQSRIPDAEQPGVPDARQATTKKKDHLVVTLLDSHVAFDGVIWLDVWLALVVVHLTNHVKGVGDLRGVVTRSPQFPAMFRGVGENLMC